MQICKYQETVCPQAVRLSELGGKTYFRVLQNTVRFLKNDKKISFVIL